MKKILFFLLFLPFAGMAQITDATLHLRDSLNIKMQGWSAFRLYNFNEDVINSKLNLRGGILPADFNLNGAFNFNLGQTTPLSSFTVKTSGAIKLLPAVAPVVGQVPMATNVDGTFTWQNIYGGSTWPTNAAGSLTNNGTGTLTWTGKENLKNYNLLERESSLLFPGNGTNALRSFTQILKLPDGRLFGTVIVFGPSAADPAAAAIYGTYSSNFGKTWGSLFLIAGIGSGTSSQCPSIYLTTGGNLVMLYLNFTSTTANQILKTVSTDSGLTWSAPTAVYNPASTYFGPASNRIIKLQNGNLLYTFCKATTADLTSQTGTYIGQFLQSTDQGTTWTFVSTSITSADGLCLEPGSYQFIDGTIQTYWRTRSGTAGFSNSVNPNDPTSWKTETGSLLNAAAGNLNIVYDPVNEILIANHCRIDRATGVGKRYLMDISVSPDKGSTWFFKSLIDQNTDVTGVVYTYSIFINDGELLLGYIKTNGTVFDGYITAIPKSEVYSFDPKVLNKLQLITTAGYNPFFEVYQRETATTQDYIKFLSSDSAPTGFALVIQQKGHSNYDGFSHTVDNPAPIDGSAMFKYYAKTNATTFTGAKLWSIFNNTTEVFTVGRSGLIFNQAALSTGALPVINIVGGALTALTANVEYSFEDKNYSQAIQFSTGTIALNRLVRYRQPTVSFVASSTITDIGYLTLGGGAVAGTNANLTNNSVVLIESGNVGAGTVNSYGFTVNAQTGGTNNYAARFLSGNVGIGVSSPTAKLHITAGSAAANTSSLKLDASTLLTTTEAGAIENNGTHLYYTAANAGTRFQLDQQSGSSPFSTTVAGYATASGNANSLIKGDNTWIAPGTNGQIFNMIGGVPTWASDIRDVNGNSILKFNPQASAINQITVQNAIAGAGPGFLATGTDTNIPLGFLTKGTGSFSFGSSTQSLTNPSFSQINTFLITRGTADNLAVEIQLSKTRGTQGAPATVVNGDFAGILSFVPYVTTSGSVITASIKGVVTGTVTSTAAPTDLVFYTGSTSAVEGLRLNSIGALTVGTGNNIVGVATNNNATTGNVGEEINAIVSTYTNYTTTATYQNITSITLTAGDWDISAFGSVSANGSTLTTSANAVFVIATATASATGGVEGQSIGYIDENFLGTSKQSIAIYPYRVSLSGSTTYYLNSQATFTLGNPQYVGSIRARRIR